MPLSFADLAESLGPRINAALDVYTQLDDGCPTRLRDAMRYSLLAPGKRMRPMLVLLAAEACGGESDAAMPAACAVEMIHAYSLIHDDLPAMDDDDLRRGRPTCHKAFDEATAILAGDGLLTLAFETLAHGSKPPTVAAACCAVLAKAAGPCNMVGGQADDVEAEGREEKGEGGREKGENRGLGTSVPSEVCKKERSGAPTLVRQLNCRTNEESPTQLSPHPNPLPKGEGTECHIPLHPSPLPLHPSSALAFLESIHRRKTGAMIQASLQLGAMVAGANPEHLTALDAYGSRIGLAFQIIDDLLDVQSNEAVVGKRVGKDAQRGKLTFPALLGLDQSTQHAQQLILEACEALAVFGPRADGLRTVAQYVLERNR